MQAVCDELKERGIVVPVAACMNKWKSLKKSYKGVEDSNRRTGAAAKTCRFYTELNDLLGGKDCVHPVALVESREDGEKAVRSFLDAEGDDVDDDDDDDDDDDGGSPGRAPKPSAPRARLSASVHKQQKETGPPPMEDDSDDHFDDSLVQGASSCGPPAENTSVSKHPSRCQSRSPSTSSSSPSSSPTRGPESTKRTSGSSSTQQSEASAAGAEPPAKKLRKKARKHAPKKAKYSSRCK